MASLVPIVVSLVLMLLVSLFLARGRIAPRVFFALAVVALGLSMVACANACPVGQLNAGCVQQVQAVQQVQYAPIVAPVAQAYVAPVVQQFSAPPIYSAPVFSAPVVQQFNAGYAAQLNVAPVAALKTRTVTRTRPVRTQRVRSKQIVAPVVAPIVVPY